MRKFLLAAAVAAVLVGAPSVSNAALIATLDGSDCAGVFGSPFGACKVPAQYDPNESPVIAKYEWDDDIDDYKWTFNSTLFPSIDGSEWSFNPEDIDDTLTGSWTYTPGVDDPAINFWVVKAGSRFFLYDLLGENPTTWALEGNGLSHITFYDTGDGGTVPEPGSLLLLGAGLVGLAATLRRRK